MAFSSVLSHVLRPLEIGKLLREMGYRLVIAGGDQAQRLANETGFDSASLSEADVKWLIANLAAGPEVLHSVERIEEAVADELQLIEEVQPDAVMCDGRITATMSARIAGLPSIAVRNAWDARYAVRSVLDVKMGGASGVLVPGIEKQYNPVRIKLGLRPVMHTLDLLEGDLNLLCDVPEYCPLRWQPDNYHFVGPITWHIPAEQPEWFDRLDPDRSTVYASMGTAAPAKILNVIIDALGNTECQVMMTTGLTVGPEQLSAPENIHLTRFASGDELSRRADLVLCHGGSGTSSQALRAGKPIVVAWPLARNSCWSAEQQMELGVGLGALNPTPGELRDMVMEVLHDAKYRETASAFRPVLSAYSAELVDDFLSKPNTSGI